MKKAPRWFSGGLLILVSSSLLLQNPPDIFQAEIPKIKTIKECKTQCILNGKDFSAVVAHISSALYSEMKKAPLFGRGFRRFQDNFYNATKPLLVCSKRSEKSWRCKNNVSCIEPFFSRKYLRKKFLSTKKAFPAIYFVPKAEVFLTIRKYCIANSVPDCSFEGSFSEGE